MRRRDGQRGPVPQEAPFDRVEALARWTAKLSTMTARGFSVPPFEHLVFGPVVHVDPDSEDPSGALRDRTFAEIARKRRHRPN